MLLQIEFFEELITLMAPFLREREREREKVSYNKINNPWTMRIWLPYAFSTTSRCSIWLEREDFVIFTTMPCCGLPLLLVHSHGVKITHHNYKPIDGTEAWIPASVDELATQVHERVQ